jgi:Tfp pilus assembly protein PilO
MSRTTLGILVASAIIAIHVLFVSPLEEKRPMLQDQLFVEHKALLKFERFTSSGENARQKLDELKKELAKTEKRVLKKQDPSLAFASLQEMVQDMAEGSGLNINSVRPLEQVEHEAYAGMPFFMDATGSTNSLSSFLKLMDASKNLIALDKLNIDRAARGGLRIKIQVSGLVLK